MKVLRAEKSKEVSIKMHYIARVCKWVRDNKPAGIYGAAVLLTGLFYMVDPQQFLQRLSFAILAIMSLLQLYELIDTRTCSK